jgi:hypothetical protein
MAARDVLQRRVVECALLTATVGGDAADGRPRLRQDAVLGVQVLQRALLKVRMDLDLDSPPVQSMRLRASGPGVRA